MLVLGDLVEMVNWDVAEAHAGDGEARGGEGRDEASRRQRAGRESGRYCPPSCGGRVAPFERHDGVGVTGGAEKAARRRRRPI